ncbi:CWF19-like protein 2 homolog [Anoplophora glabripennis]|uniref:CWF19-like protein 2 homolog n=1 Tax=Anoplophora glabripennis TaxID=217634 RepID=UPI0008747822|nr:CWF19-like protein 2 homolog [Anoplophora glabripennis]
MGKHKEESKKHKKNKKKIVKKQTKKYSSSSEEEWVEKKVNTSSSSSEEEYNKKSCSRKQKYCSSSEEEWVEKKVNSSSSSSEENYNKKSSSHKRKYSFEEDNRNTSSSDDETKKKKEKPKHTGDLGGSVVDNESDKNQREDWMGLPTCFLTSSNSDRKKERDEVKRLKREKQHYDPRLCSRELNPYWKDGGDGLPKFKKPNIDDEHVNYHNTKSQCYNETSNWRKKKDAKEIGLSDSIKLHSGSKLENSGANLSGTNSDNVLSEKELNLLAAKLVKAELMGNIKLVTELKDKLDKARNCQKDIKSSKIQEEEILLTHTDSQGRSQPLKQQSEYGESSGSHKRKKKVETHRDGQRVRYFADDDKYSLKQMFESEKYNSVEDQNSEFVKMAGKIRKNDDLDDIFADNIRKQESDSKIDAKKRDKAVNEHQRIAKSLDNCNRCIQSETMLKHLMVFMRETSYLALPSYEPLTEGHCLIIPFRHVPCSTQLDENEWSEILDIRRDLVKLFHSKNEEIIFFETAISLNKFPHMFIECIPMPKEDGDMAPIYFKKAIDESETEWALNKKLVSLKGRDVRKAIPKGLPYFSVSFGMEQGFAHVIEDEQMFPRNFAQEIIGGMLDVHHSKWRKPKRQSFDEQSKRVLAFSKDWKEFEQT